MIIANKIPQSSWKEELTASKVMKGVGVNQVAIRKKAFRCSTKTMKQNTCLTRNMDSEFQSVVLMKPFTEISQLYSIIHENSVVVAVDHNFYCRK